MNPYVIYVSADPEVYRMQQNIITAEAQQRAWIGHGVVRFTPQVTDEDAESTILVKHCDLFIAIVGDELKGKIITEIHQALAAERRISVFIQADQMQAIHVRGIMERLDARDVHTFSDTAGLVSQILNEIRKVFATKLREQQLGDETAVAVSPNLDLFKVQRLLGRDTELRELQTWIATEPAGYKVITGVPGVGKTSLLASLVDHLPPDVHCVRVSVTGHFENRPGTVLDNLVKQLAILVGSEFTQESPNLDAVCSNFSQALLKASHDHLKVVVIVDAVDQGTDPATGRRLVDHLPFPVPDGIHVILSTKESALDLRPGWDRFPLAPLPADAAKVVLADLGLALPLLERVVQAADGLPLYLELLIRDLKSGRISSKDLADRVPASFNEYLEHLWRQRVSAKGRRLLGAIALARRPITLEELCNVLGQNSDEVLDCADYVESLISRTDPHTYTVFHRAVREFVTSQIGHPEARTLHDKLAMVLGPSDPDYAFHLFHAERFSDVITFANLAFTGMPVSFDHLQEMRVSLTYAFMACKKLRDVHQAIFIGFQLALLHELEREGAPVGVLTWLARYGHSEKALARAQALRDPRRVTNAYLEIAEVLSGNREQRELFRTVLDRAVTSARSLPREQFAELAVRAIHLVISYDPDLALPLLEELLALRSTDWSVLIHLVLADVGSAKHMLDQLKQESDGAFYLSLINMVTWVSIDELQRVYNRTESSADKLLLLVSFALTQQRHCSASQVTWLETEIGELVRGERLQKYLDLTLLQYLRQLAVVTSYDFTNPKYIWKLTCSNSNPTHQAKALACIITLSRQHCAAELPWLCDEASRVSKQETNEPGWGIALCELAAALSDTHPNLAQDLVSQALIILEAVGLDELSLAGNFLVPAASAIGGMSIDAILILAQLCPYDWQINPIINSILHQVFSATWPLPAKSLREILDLVHVMDERSPSPTLYLNFIGRVVVQHDVTAPDIQPVVAEALCAIAGTMAACHAYITLATAAAKHNDALASRDYLSKAVREAAVLETGEQAEALFAIGVAAVEANIDTNWCHELLQRALRLYMHRPIPVTTQQMLTLARALAVSGAQESTHLIALIDDVEKLTDHNDKASIYALLADFCLRECMDELCAKLSTKLFDLIPAVTSVDASLHICSTLARLTRRNDLDKALWIAQQAPPDDRASIGCVLIEDELRDHSITNRSQRVLAIIDSFSNDGDKWRVVKAFSELTPQECNMAAAEWTQMVADLRSACEAQIKYMGYWAVVLADLGRAMGRFDKHAGLMMLDDAKTCIRDVKNRSDRVFCLCRTIHVALAMGASDTAVEAAKTAEHELQNISLPAERISRGLDLVEQLRRMGDSKRARTLTTRLKQDSIEIDDPRTMLATRTAIFATMLQIDDANATKQLERTEEPSEHNRLAVKWVERHPNIVKARGQLLSLRGKPEEVTAFDGFISRLWDDDKEPVTAESFLGLLEQGIDLGIPIVSRLTLLAFKRKLEKPSLSQFRSYLNSQTEQINGLVRRWDAQMASDVLGTVLEGDGSELSEPHVTVEPAQDITYIAPSVSSAVLVSLAGLATKRLCVITGGPDLEDGVRIRQRATPEIRYAVVTTKTGRFPLRHTFLIVDGIAYKAMGGMDVSTEGPLTRRWHKLGDTESEAVKGITEQFLTPGYSFAGDTVHVRHQ